MTMLKQTQEWVDSQSEWVGLPLHSLAVAQLLHLAEQIDLDPSKPSLMAQYGLTYRSLLAERPKDPEGFDELDLLLRDSAGQGVSNG